MQVKRQHLKNTNGLPVSSPFSARWYCTMMKSRSFLFKSAIERSSLLVWFSTTQKLCVCVCMYWYLQIFCLFFDCSTWVTRHVDLCDKLCLSGWPDGMLDGCVILWKLWHWRLHTDFSIRFFHFCHVYRHHWPLRSILHHFQCPWLWLKANPLGSHSCTLLNLWRWCLMWC